MNTPKLSIVIPCYNEAENIPLLIKSIDDVYKPGTEIILVDNGSTDQTSVVLNKELSRYANSFIRSIRVSKNIGYGHGIMSGIKECSSDFIAWTHADLQTDIKDVFNGYKLFVKQKEPHKVFLKGRRKKRKVFDALLTTGMSIITSFTLGQRLTDINAQPKIFHRSFIDKLENTPDDSSLDLYALYVAKKNNIKIIELPVFFNERLYGEAKGGGGGSLSTRIKLIQRTIAYIFKLKREIRSRKS